MSELPEANARLELAGAGAVNSRLELAGGCQLKVVNRTLALVKTTQNS